MSAGDRQTIFWIAIAFQAFKIETFCEHSYHLMSGEVYNKDSFQTQFRLQKYILQHASHKLATSTLEMGLRGLRVLPVLPSISVSWRPAFLVVWGWSSRASERAESQDNTLCQSESVGEREDSLGQHCIALLLQSAVLEVASNCDWHYAVGTLGRRACIQTGVTSSSNQIVSLTLQLIIKNPERETFPG